MTADAQPVTGRSGEEKVAVVTGGTSGIGLGIATAMKEAGYRVAVLGRRREALDAVRPLGLDPFRGDVSDADSVAQAVGAIVDAHRRIDVLVNNAGIIHSEALATMGRDKIDAQVRVNLLGTIYVTQACIPALIESRGTIINISSGLAKRPVMGHAVYSATKGAVESFSRVMALELAEHGIRVNVIAPGLVRSAIYTADGMSEDDYEGMFEKRGSRYLLGRAGDPADIAAMAVYLASEKASWITGVVYPVDGGIRDVGMKPEP